ncbi:MAG: MFS transporter, partial [Patescibacteria group bacterium]
FDFPRMWHMLFNPDVGIIFVISLIFFLAFSCALMYGFQPFTINILRVTESQNAVLFTIFGAIGLISQTFLVGPISKALGIKKSFTTGMIFTAFSFVIMFFSRSLPIFILASIILSLSNSIVQTLIPTILSREADEKSQGSIMGLNASYQSMGMIFGPILGGMAATVAIPLPFLVGSILVFICFLFSFRVLRPGMKKQSAF